MTAPVVVGIDDIDHSWHAVSVAAREAGLRGAPLWVGHAYQWLPPATVGMIPGADTPEGAVRDAADELLATAVTRVHSLFPEVETHSYAMSGPAARCLADLAHDAALLVVGGRGAGGFNGLLLGSVALRTVGHAPGPVMIVRGAEHPATGRIVVGVGLTDTAGDPQALAMAFAEAALRGAEVRVLHVWDNPYYSYPASIGQFSRAQLDAVIDDRTLRLDRAVAPWRDKFPEVTAGFEVVHGAVAENLVEATRRADLLVIGGRRHRDGEGMHIGGLAHALLHHAECPVVIVPEG